MKNAFTLILVLLIVVQVNAQSEKYAIKFSNELVNHEQSMRDKREKILLKYHQEKDIYKTHLIPNQNKQYKQPLSASVSKTVNCTAGNLSTLLTTDELNTVTDLTITGTIDARDFKTMRDNMPMLTVLDINSITISQYSGTLGTVNSSQVYEQNCIPQYAFRQPGWFPAELKLASIKLPNSLVSIKEHAFECTSLSGELTIPSSVVEIGDQAFFDLVAITHISLSSTLKKIGAMAFYGCNGLNGILQIPTSVELIGVAAFKNCGDKSSLEILSNKLTTIESSTFEGSFTGNLIIPNGVKIIKDNAFSICSFSGTLVLPSSLESIGNNAFEGCSGLTGLLSIPSSVKQIGVAAFADCNGINGLSLPNSITKISEFCFENDSSLTGNLTIPSSVDTIGSSAFSNCKGLQNLTLNAGLKVIESSAFENCTGLTCLSLPIGISKIDNQAFMNCKELSGTLIIPSTIDTVFSKTFANCANLEKLILSENIKEIEESAFEDCLNLDGKIVIPSSVKKIKFRAFRNTSNLDSIAIPSSLDTIESLSFWGTGGRFFVDANNKNHSSLEGVLYNKKLNKLICCPTSFKGDFFIPFSVDTLSIGSFINCSQITSVRIPSKMSMISSGTFGFCSNIKNVYVYSNSPAKLVADGFYGVNLAECTLHVPKNSKTVYSNTDTWKNFPNIVEDDDIGLSNSLLLTSSTTNNIVVTIYTNGNWSASSDQSWLTVSPSSGTGNATITLTAEENNTTAERTAIVTVSAAGLPSQTITVTQQGASLSLSVSSNSISIAKEANSSATVEITSNTNWIASSNLNWLTVSPISGTGNATITFTAEENNTNAERTAIVTVSATGLPNQTVTVMQAGKTTGIEDLTNSLINIYPNPANQNFSINGFEGIATVEIFNINGELKMKYVSEANKPISVVNIPNGLYLLKIKTSTGIVNRKLIVE